MADPSEVADPSAPRPATFLRIAREPRAQLEALIGTGATPDPRALVGWEYRGVNTPRAARALGIRRFIKGFRVDDDGDVAGYNLRVTQGPLAAPWEPPRKASARRQLGFFSVRAADARRGERAYPAALVLDYSRRGNRDVSRFLRDHVVRVTPGSDELLLGKAYLVIGPLRVPVSYFVLERLRRTGADLRD